MGLSATFMKWLFVVACPVVLLVAGWIIVPNALDAWAWVSAKDDPLALTKLGLKTALTPARLRSELSSALEAGDLDLAAGIVALAEQQGMEIPTSLWELYSAVSRPAEVAKRGATDFYHGFAGGEASSGVGVAGVVAGDLAGFGDLRDLVREGTKIAQGEEPDQPILGLAVVGLAVTGATIASFGAVLPVRSGISTMRAAAKAGRLSKPLATSVGHMLQKAFDRKAMTAAAAAIARFDVAAARPAMRRAVRPVAFAELRDVAGKVVVIGRRAGGRGAQEALAVSHDAADLSRVARIARSRGISTRAVLKILGRGAFALTTAGLTLFGWTVAGLGYIWIALMLAVAVSRRAVCAVALAAARMVSSAAFALNHH
jgi:hypothetical protein